MPTTREGGGIDLVSHISGVSPLWQWVVTIAVPALSALVGLFVGHWMSVGRDTAQRKLSFLERQLRDLYAPLLGIRSQIRALLEVRIKVSEATDSAWRELCERYRENPDALERLSKERGDEFCASIHYGNQQWREVLLPYYSRMVDTLRENLWLAQPETRAFLSVLIEFVDLWNRWLSGTIPREAAETLDIGEEGLHPFYADVARTHDDLQAKLRRGAA